MKNKNPVRKNRKLTRWLKLFCVGVVIGLSALVSIVVIKQDYLILPVVGAPAEPAPKEVESIVLHTTDGERIEAWRLPSNDNAADKKVALLFHGNGDTLTSFLGHQREFQKQGYISYSINYRGVGGSTGWPSEQGLYKDAEALWKYVLEREHALPNETVFFGFSLGTGFAAKLAEEHEGKGLILVAPYTSITEVVKQRLLTGLLAPFLKYDVPTLSRINKLKSHCIGLFHGREDTSIFPSHSERLKREYNGKRDFMAKFYEGKGHVMMSPEIWNDIFLFLENCRS